MMTRFAPAITAMALIAAPAAAQEAPKAEIVRITPGQALAKIANLKSGTRDYLRFMKQPDGTTKIIAHERSTVSIEGDGEARRVHIAHDGAGPDLSYGFKSTFMPSTLEPLSHPS